MSQSKTPAYVLRRKNRDCWSASTCDSAKCSSITHSGAQLYHQATSRQTRASVKCNNLGVGPERLQVLQSKCLRLVTGAPWYLSNRQIHEDLGVPFLADHIRALTASFDSRLADVGNPLVRQLGRYLLWPRVGLVPRSVNRERRVPADQSRLPLAGGQVDQTNRARQ